jgi:hypothetical protein
MPDVAPVTMATLPRRSAGILAALAFSSGCELESTKQNKGDVARRGCAGRARSLRAMRHDSPLSFLLLSAAARQRGACVRGSPDKTASPLQTLQLPEEAQVVLIMITKNACQELTSKAFKAPNSWPSTWVTTARWRPLDAADSCHIFPRRHCLFTHHRAMNSASESYG